MYMCRDHFAALRAASDKSPIRAEAETCMACLLAQGDSSFPTRLGEVATFLRSVWKEQASTPTDDSFAILELADAEMAHTNTLLAAGITEESMLESYRVIRAAYCTDAATATRKA